MNKKQKIQELTERIEKSQAEIDELKQELEKLQKKPYEISYPEDGTEMYYIDDYTGELEELSDLTCCLNYLTSNHKK